MLYVLPIGIIAPARPARMQSGSQCPGEKIGIGAAGRDGAIFLSQLCGQVEAYITRPHAAAPTPLVILLHGHSLAGRGAVQVLRAAETLSDDLLPYHTGNLASGYGATDVPSGSIPTVTRQVVLDGLALDAKAELGRCTEGFLLRSFARRDRCLRAG
jgi:hypothetical protein